MGKGGHLLHSRVGVAILGAILVGGIAALAGVGTVWRPQAPFIGGVMQGNGTATTALAQETETNGTATPAETATPQPTATAIPTRAPTATPNLVGSTIRGSVVSTNASTNSFVMSRNGTRYTILVNESTTYSGVATQFSGLQPGYRVSVAIAAQNGSAYLASSVISSIDR